MKIRFVMTRVNLFKEEYSYNLLKTGGSCFDLDSNKIFFVWNGVVYFEQGLLTDTTLCTDWLVGEIFMADGKSVIINKEKRKVLFQGTMFVGASTSFYVPNDKENVQPYRQEK